jgi:hypothetical protein
LSDRLAALDRRVLGPPGDTQPDDYWNWWRVTEPRAKWTALLGYAVVCGLAVGLPDLLFDYPSNRVEALIAGLSYWPLTWHFYLQHRKKPEYRPVAPQSH